MREKAQGWIERAKSIHLHKQNLWFLLEVQFWPRVSFGQYHSTILGTGGMSYEGIL
jgi:hypothetical protein